jgi:hypothetical protein
MLGNERSSRIINDINLQFIQGTELTIVVDG